MSAMSRRQRRKAERRMRAEIRELTRRWLGVVALYQAAERENDRLMRMLEDERRAKYAELLVHADPNVPRGVIRLVQRVT